MFGAIALVVVAQNAQQTQFETDPNVVVSNMMLRYFNAKSLSGTIVQETTDGSGKVKITTKVSYQRPGHVYVSQDYKGRNGLYLMLVSDGVKFAYDPPWDSKIPPSPRERLLEPVVIQREGTGQSFVHGVGEMYHAAHKSLMPSTVLDLAIAFRTHLNDFRINVGSIAMRGIVDLDGKKAYHIAGDWRPYIGANKTGGYEIWISPSYDVLRFRLSETYKVGNRTIAATTTEIADLKIDVSVDAKLFVVR